MKKLALILALCIPWPSHATVPNANRSVTYTGAGGTEYTIGFTFILAEQIKVTRTLISSGVGTVLTQGCDTADCYTVTLPIGPISGIVSTVTAVASTHTLTIERVTPLTQNTSFSSQGRYSAAAHENAVDKLTMIAQEIADNATIDADIASAISTHSGEADPHTGYFLLAGRTGGQTANGSDTAGQNLVLQSNTSNDAAILFGSSGSYHEGLNRLGVNTISPTKTLHVAGEGLFTNTLSGTDLTLSGSAVVDTDVTTPIIQGDGGTGSDLTLKSNSLDDGDIIFGDGIFQYETGAGYDLGIGTNNPTYKLAVVGDAFVSTTLDVNGNVAFGAVLDVVTRVESPIFQGKGGTGTPVTIVSNDSSDDFIYFGAAQTTAFDEANDYLGIGKAAPAVALDVIGDGVLSGGFLAVGDLNTYADVVALSGRVYAPAVRGGVTSGLTLTLASNNSGDGFIYLGGAATSAYDEAQDFLGIGDATPQTPLEVRGDAAYNNVSSTFGAAYTVGTTTYDCGGYFFSSTSDAEITLPLVGSGNQGCKITLMNTGGAQRVKLKPNAADAIYGRCDGVSSGGVTGKGFWLTSGTANSGDRVTVIAEGSKSWWITECEGAWASEP